MNTTISFFTDKIYTAATVNGLRDVVSKVVWVMVLERNGATTKAVVSTILDTASITQESFKPVTQLTADEVLGWAIQAEGGDAFLEHIKQIHEPMLARAEFEKTLVVWDIPLLEPKKWDDSHA
jgi:hypothetical protein